MEDVNDALMAGAGRAADSLDEPLSADQDAGATRLDGIVDGRDEFAAADAAVTFDQLTEVLDPRAREVIRLRYREDLLQWQIGERVGCSQMHVSRILTESIATLSEYVEGFPRLAQAEAAKQGADAIGLDEPADRPAAALDRGRPPVSARAAHVALRRDRVARVARRCEAGLVDAPAGEQRAAVEQQAAGHRGDARAPAASATVAAPAAIAARALELKRRS